jgi:hypothetical protein
MPITRFGSRRGGPIPLLLLLAAPLAVSSCGGGSRLHPVHGQVFYEGKPAAGAVVFFHPQGDPPAGGGSPSAADLPSGKVGSDGSFELTTYKQGKGAPVGRYAVTISWEGPSAGADGDGPELLPPRYQDPTTSQLSAEVKEGDNKLPPFQLTR